MLTKRHPDWRLDEKRSADMQDIVSQRVMAMTRQVGSTARRPKKPPWFNQLFERDDVMTTAAVVLLERLPTIADDGLDTESATASNIEWHTRWNAEIGERGKACNSPTKSPKAKEYTDQLIHSWHLCAGPCGGHVCGWDEAGDPRVSHSCLGSEGDCGFEEEGACDPQETKWSSNRRERQSGSQQVAADFTVPLFEAGVPDRAARS